MSARILYSLTDEKAGVQKQTGCMNGIFQLFDRNHFLSGGRRAARSNQKRLTAGQNGNYGAEEDTMSLQSTRKISKATKERHRLSTDSSRSSASSSCNSSSFSSIEDNKSARMEPLPLAPNSMEFLAKDLPKLQQLHVSKHSGENPLPKSAAMVYADSPRPMLQSKIIKERNPAVSESFRDFPSIHRPQSIADRPRFSCDGRESRDAFKPTTMKLREQPRHSLDSKRGSLLSSSSKVQQLQEEPGSCKWQSSVVAKLMGLEATPDAPASSKLQMGHSRNSLVEALDPFLISSRVVNECNHGGKADLVVRLRSNVSPLERVEEVAAATKDKDTQLLSPALSVYAEMVKRLEEIEFKKSGNDLRALKQILEAMQKTKQQDENKEKMQHIITERSNISRSDFTSKYIDRRGRKSACPMSSPEVRKPVSPKNAKSLPVIAKPDVNFAREQIPHSRIGTSALSKLQVSTKIQRNSSDQQRNEDLTPRPSSRHAHYTNRSSVSRNVSTRMTEERQQITITNKPGRNVGNLSPRLQRKKPERTDSPKRSNQPGREPREPLSPCRTPKSKIPGDIISSKSRKPSEQSIAISSQSDDNTSLVSRDDDTEVTSSYVEQDEQSAEKVPSPSEFDEESYSKSGMTLVEQPSPVSVLDSTYLEDESPSPVKMMPEAFKDDEAPHFHRQGRGSHASSDSFPREKQSTASTKPQTENTHPDHTYILQILSASGLLGGPEAGNWMTIQLHPSGRIMSNVFDTLEQDKASNNRLSGGDYSKGSMGQSKRGERIQKKLLFDVIDELMVQKLTSYNRRNRFSLGSPAARKTGQEHLLKGLCSEIAQLQADNFRCNLDDEEDEIKAIIRRDLKHESQSWTGRFDNSGVVLDIERLIFKDLVTEVVSSEAAAGLRSGLNKLLQAAGS